MSRVEKVAPFITATTCKNCACPKRGHLEDGGCLKHLFCGLYAPLGRRLARDINSRVVLEPRRGKGKR